MDGRDYWPDADMRRADAGVDADVDVDADADADMNYCVYISRYMMDCGEPSL